MHTGAGRGGRRAEEDRGVRGGVGHAGEPGPDHGLEPGERAGGDVTADVVGVAHREPGRSGDRPCQDQVAEPGREALQLALDDLGGVTLPAGRDVPVRPEDVASFGGASRVDEAGLRGDQERDTRVAPGHGRAQGRVDLGGRGADVDGPGPPGLLGCPGHGAREGVIDLEAGGAVAVVVVRAAETRDPGERRGRGVEDVGAGGREFVEALDLDARADGAALLAQERREGVGDRL